MPQERETLPDPIRVCLNQTPVFTSQAGVARYVRGLLSGFARLEAPLARLDCMGWPVRNFDKPQPWRSMVTAWRDLVWRPVVPRWRAATGGFDVVHDTLSWSLPPLRGVATVATVHDAAMLRHPERFRKWHRRTSLRAFHAAKGCDRVLAISRFTADELCRLGGFDPRRIEVVHNGCDFVGGPAPVEQPIAEFDGEPFFLFVGSLEPGKNLALLRQVYERAAAKGRELPRLRIVGARWPGVEREGRPPGQWTYHGHLPDAQLVFLYRRALALVFPSRYEGFGLPLIEAMALGCPVVCSPVASLPEVGGEAVRYAEMEPEAYLEAMREVSGDSVLRAGLVERGLGRAEGFTWRRCAEETAAVYQMAVAARNRR